MNTVALRNEFNEYPDIISYDEKNPTLTSPYSDIDCPFYMTKDMLIDVDLFRSFVKNAESAFRASPEYKLYKSYLIEYLGLNRCQVFGNVTMEDAKIELHHNVIPLLDMCILITSHIVNTVGYITTFDLITLLIQEHYQNNVGVVFLSTTAHQLYHHDEEGYLPPEMTFGRWWVLLSKYKYGITFDLANKIVNYLTNYSNNKAITVNPKLNDAIYSYANFNEYCNISPQEAGYLPNLEEFMMEGF